MSNHSKTPWTVFNAKNGHDYIYCANGAEIARMGSNNMLTDDSSAEANAAFIVTACNAHGQLVALNRIPDNTQGLRDAKAALAAAGVAGVIIDQIIEVGGQRWKIKEAASLEGAQHAISMCRCTGSVGTKMEETRNGVTVITGHVVRLNDDGTERQPT